MKRLRRCSASYRPRHTGNSSRAAAPGGDGASGDNCEASSAPAAERHDALSVLASGALLPASREDSAGVGGAWSPHVESALEAEADRRAQLPETEEQVSEVDVLTPDGDFSCFFPPPPPPHPPRHPLHQKTGRLPSL